MNNITTKESTRTGSQLSIGQYVKYEPSGGSTSYSSTQAHNGNGNQTISRESLNWRVLSVSGNIVKIISDATSGTVTYADAEGYNNAVKDLNDMCKTLYSHGTTEARSVNLEDFTTSSFKSNFSQTTAAYTASSSYNKFPTIYQYEYNGSLGQSQQSQWYSGTYNNTNFKSNYWTGSIPSDSPLHNSSYCWLSSREVSSYKLGSTCYAWVGLQSLGGILDILWLYDTRTTPNQYNNHVRAVVSLLSSVTFGTETGDQSSPITINW